MGAQPPLVIPPRFLAGQPAHPLNKGAFDLALVDGRVQGTADVVKRVDTFDSVLTGERVERDFRAGRAIAKVVKRSAASLRPVPVNFGAV